MDFNLLEVYYGIDAIVDVQSLELKLNFEICIYTIQINVIHIYLYI